MPLTTTFNLTLDDEERAELFEVLRETLMETHGEMRRTEAPAYQEKVHHEEAILRRLMDKVAALSTE